MDEVHFSEAAYFDELAEDGEVAPARPRGTPLPKWEDLEEEEPRVDNSDFTSQVGRERGDKNKQGNKRTRRESDRPGKIRLTDERTAYLLKCCKLGFFYGVCTPKR